ncbi:MAG TPA: DNA repair and recombination protein RadA [Candidatus Lokiarchaeia archaeon]|nr:DNA repair and recombination protein RadA [Candidatus Lokiarchaeia archaeon]
MSDIEDEIDNDLPNLKGMTPKIMKLLAEEGITSIRQLAMASVDEISKIQGVSDNKARQIIYAAREQLGMCEFVQVDQIKENYEWFTTGSENVDDLMDGGITTGRITELFGGFKSGKTNTCNTLCVTVQLPKEEGGLDGDVIYIDTEGTFSKAKVARIARRFGIDPEKALSHIHLAKVYSADHQMQMIEQSERLVAKYPVKLIIVDSLMALLRNEYVGIGCLAPRQAKLNKIIHLLSRIAEAKNIAVVLTNQVVTKFLGQIAVEDAVGGNIVAHGCHFRYRLKAKGASFNETLERFITVVDSVDLAPGTAQFVITEAGIADDAKIVYKIKEPSPYELKAGNGAMDRATELAKAAPRAAAKKSGTRAIDLDELDSDDTLAEAIASAKATPTKPLATDDELPDLPKEQVRATINCLSCGKAFTSKKTLANHTRSCKAKETGVVA